MTTGLISEWRKCARAAEAWEAGEDPEPVLEALAMSLALEVTGGLAEIGADERDTLRRVGQRALLHVGGRDMDEDDLEALRLAASVARDGLRALSGRPLPESATEARRDLRIVVPPSELGRLLRGELDGLTAGSLAMQIRRSAPARAELAMLIAVTSDETERPLSLAAASAAAVLDPVHGRRVATLTELGVEAVFFDGPEPRLAVYGEDPAPLRLLSEVLTTEDVREGYWIGRVAPGTEVIDAVLQIDDASVAWEIRLD